MLGILVNTWIISLTGKIELAFHPFVEVPAGIGFNRIEACKLALLKKSKNVLDANFIEGMACVGGCIGGAGCLTHGEKNKAEVDKYGREAHEKNISDAISLLK